MPEKTLKDKILDLIGDTLAEQYFYGNYEGNIRDFKNTRIDQILSLVLESIKLKKRVNHFRSIAAEACTDGYNDALDDLETLKTNLLGE